MSSPTHFLTIKITHDNFLLWKAQLVPFLKGRNLYSFVDDNNASSPPDDQNPSWIQTDQAIMSLLISSMSENLVVHVIEDTSSREIWIILTDLFSAKSQARLMQVQLQLTRLKKGSDTNVVYYQKAKHLHDTLAVAGKMMSNTEFITFLLAGL